MPWDVYSFKLSKGKHTLQWRYVKGAETSEGNDRAAVDMVSFPPQSVIKHLDAVENLKAKLQENATLVLTWDASENADEYIVRRNGEIVSAQSETSYDENVSEGIYTYSVVARSGDLYSAPAFVIFDSNKKSTESINDFVTEKILVYPNPTSGMLYVKSDSFDAVVYNYQGQVVLRRNNNDGQIDLSDLTAGIYFLEIREHNNVMIEKIILTK